MGGLIEEHTSTRVLFQVVDWILISSYWLIIALSLKRLQNQSSTHYENLIKALLYVFIITSLCNNYLVRITFFLQNYIDFPSEALIVFLILPTYLCFYTPLIFTYILFDFHLSLKPLNTDAKCIYALILKIIFVLLSILIPIAAIIFIVLTYINYFSKKDVLGGSVTVSDCFWFTSIIILVSRGCRLKSCIKQLNYGNFGGTLISKINLILVFAIIFYVICTSIIMFCRNFYTYIENENLK